MNQDSKRTISLLGRDGDCCHYCGVQTRGPGEVEQSHPTRRTTDHLIPLSKGGGNRLDNLVIACFNCNQARADIPYEVFKAAMDEIMVWWSRDEDDNPRILAP